MTSCPAPIFSAISASSNASVPEETPMPNRHWLYAATSFSSFVTSGPRINPWLAQTFSMAARASALKLAYCGFRSSRGTCMVDSVIVVAKRRASLADWGLELLPQALPLAGFTDKFEEGLVGLLLVRRGGHHAQRAGGTLQGLCRRALLMVLREAALSQPQCDLPAGHGQVHLAQQLRIQQRTVQLASGIVHAVTPAQGVEAIALARVQLARQGQRIHHRTHRGHRHRLPGQAGKFRIQEGHVEGGIVDDQFGAPQEVDQFSGDLRELG